MKWLLIFAALLILAAIAAITGKQPKGKRLPPEPTPSPLTKREQPMFFRLQETFPEHVVLAQVAFSALLRSKHVATRNTFDRKVADFVLCSKAFKVLAVIELDDSSHEGRGQQDKAREALLTEAGYRVLRYKHVPDADVLRTALVPAISTAAEPSA